MATDTDLKTFRDFLMQYNNVTEHCFGACVNDLTSRFVLLCKFLSILKIYIIVFFRTVSSKEESCSNNCLDKYLKMTQRVSLRFQEHQMLSAEVNGAPLPKSK